MQLLRLIMLSLAVFLFQGMSAQPVRKALDDKGLYKPGSLNPSLVKKSVRKEASDDEWVALGTGRFRDDFITTFYLLECLEFDVEIEESATTPGLYRLKSPYKNYPYASAIEMVDDTYMEINATDPDHVFFVSYDTGFSLNTEDGTFFISSIAGYQYEHYGNIKEAIEDGECGTLRDGEITFPHASLLVRGQYDSDTQWRYANYNNGFRVRLPGAPDLDVSISINGLDETEENKISVNFQIGSGCEKVKVAMVPGDYTDNMYDGIVNGTITSTEITESQDVLFPYEKDGVYSFVAVPYIGESPKKVAYLISELTLLNTGWKSWGNCEYTEGIICDNEVAFEGLTVETYPVEIQEKLDAPGYYRLVDPYGLTYRYSSSNSYDTNHKYYMEIDATDHDAVSIKRMDNGCGLNLGVGTMIIWSKADRELTDRGKTKEEVAKMGYFGKLENGVITFPTESILIQYYDFKPDTYYWGNANGHFKVVLPEEAAAAGIKGVDTATSGANGVKEYFTIDGIKVVNPSAFPGLYIVRENGKCFKTIIK